MKGLDGKVAIIPGGATKIGAAIAQAFRAAGTKVMIADINEEAGQALVGDGIAFCKTNLREDDDIAALVAATKKEFGRIDFLVNVACSYLDNGAESTRAEWMESLDVNIVGSVMLMQTAREELAKNSGAIVNFGSISARVAQKGRWLYPVSKAAILQLTRNQAMDLAPDGIRVNAVSP
ncbi:MAG: SDR family oxidoreductase, partial [Pseudomonadota bacterium]|nr:SDR family oxidoreductase [Pseudomonadota bacterium]